MSDDTGLAPWAPWLEGWYVMVDVASELGISRQAVHKAIRERRLRTVHTIGKPGTGRPLVYIVAASEVAQAKEAGGLAAGHAEDGIPHLEGWLTLMDAADELGMSKQGVHKMVKERKFRSLHKVGRPGTGRPSAYIVLETEVAGLQSAGHLAGQDAG